MTPSCSSSSPALVPVLLAMLLGGEWGHVSVRLGVCLSLHLPWTLRAPHPCGKVAAGTRGLFAEVDTGSER